MDNVTDNSKPVAQPLNLSNFSLKDTGNLVAQESQTKSQYRKFKDGKHKLEIQSEQFEVSKMPIRANWLISSSRREYEIVITQAFIYLFADKDYQFSVKSKFPVKMQQKLKEAMTLIKSIDYKIQVKNILKVKWKKKADISTFEKETYFLQLQYTQNIEKDFQPIFFDVKGILFYDFSKETKEIKSNDQEKAFKNALEKEARFKYTLIRSEFQEAPSHHLLHQKIYKGMLGWYKSEEMKHRLHLTFLNKKDQRQQGAIYSTKKSELRKIRNFMIVFNGLATNAGPLMKFLAFRWKVLSATQLLGKLISFNKNVLRNKKIDIDRVMRFQMQEYLDLSASKRSLTSKRNALKDSQVDFDINKEISENTIILRPLYFILVDTPPTNPVLTITYVLKKDHKNKTAEKPKGFLKRMVMKYFLDTELKTKKHTYWVFKTKEKDFFVLDKYFEITPHLKLNYKVNLGLVEISAGLLMDEKKINKISFFSSNKPLNNGGFTICPFFILNTKNNPFKNKRNIFETSYFKEQLKWELVPKHLLEQIDKSFESQKRIFSTLPTRFLNMKKELQIRESVNFFEHLLFRDKFVDLFLEGPDNYAMIWRQCDNDFLGQINHYISENSSYLIIPEDDFRTRMLVVLSNVSPNIKGAFFQEFTKKCKFRYFHFDDSTGDAKKRKRPAHMVLNKDPEFSGPEEMTERLSTLVKLCVGTMQENEKRNRTLVEKILFNMAERMSPFYTFHSNISSMVEYFYLIIQLFKNYLKPLGAKQPAVPIDYDKKLLRDIFVEMFLLKMMLKQRVPKVYDHILMIGSSVEDLFMNDSMNLFFGSFSLNFSLQFADLMVLFGNGSSKYSLIWIVLKILLVRNLIEANTEIFLAARTSSEVLAAKKNVFKFYEFSEKNVAEESLLYQTVRDYCKMELTPMKAEDKFNFNAEFEGDPFSVYKFSNLESFQTLEKLYIQMKRRLSADYKMFDFVYERTDDVIQFFSSARQIPWKFERDDELIKLMEKMKVREETRKRGEEGQEEEESDDESASEDEDEEGEDWEEWELEDDAEETTETEEEQLSTSRADFQNFAEDRKQNTSGRHLQKSGLMTSNLLNSQFGNMEIINEQNETKRSVEIENSFDPEAIGEVFRPYQVQFEKEKSIYILRFKLFGINPACFALSAVPFKDRVFDLEVNYRGKSLLHEKYSLQKNEFESLQKVYEIKSRSKPYQLDFQCWIGESQFKGSLLVESFYDNTFERIELGLTNAKKGHIFVNLGLVLQSPDDEPYNDFVMNDAGYAFCLDRMIESDLVLKRPHVLEINSTKKMVNIYKVMRAPLKQMTVEFKQEFHNVLTKYFEGEENVILIKIFLFYAINSEDIEDSEEKLDLLWDILIFFQGQDNKISLSTFEYFMEVLFINFFPFMNPVVAHKMAERMIVGYSGNVVQCRLLNRDFEAMFDLTDFMQSFLVQNQIYSSSRFINFLDDKFHEVIQTYLKKHLSELQKNQVKYIQLVLFKNNHKSSLLIHFRPTPCTSFKRLFRKDISKLFVDLNNSFWINKEGFYKRIMAESLLCILLGLPNGESEHEKQVLVQIAGESIPCLLENNFLVDINSANVKLKLYLNKNPLCPETAFSQNIIL